MLKRRELVGGLGSLIGLASVGEAHGQVQRRLLGGRPALIMPGRNSYRKAGPALRRVLANTGRWKGMWVGDSATAGAGAGSGGAGGVQENACIPNSYPNQIAALWAAAGIRTATTSSFGDHGAPVLNGAATTTTEFVAIDPRHSFSGSTYTDYGFSGGFTAGGYFLTLGSTYTGVWAMNPSATTDSCDLFAATFGGSVFGTINVDIGAAAFLSANTGAGGGGAGFSKYSGTTTRGSNTYNIKGTTPGTFPLGLDLWDSTLLPASFWNMGSMGARTGDWATTTQPYNGTNTFATLAPDVFFINLLLNDFNQSIPLATAVTNYQTVITAAKATGADVQLFIPHRGATIGNAFDLTPAWQGAITNLAVKNGLPDPINLRNVALTATDYFDTIHLTTAGYAKIAAYVSPILLSRML